MAGGLEGGPERNRVLRRTAAGSRKLCGLCSTPSAHQRVDQPTAHCLQPHSYACLSVCALGEAALLAMDQDGSVNFRDLLETIERALYEAGHDVDSVAFLQALQRARPAFLNLLRYKVSMGCIEAARESAAVGDRSDRLLQTLYRPLLASLTIRRLVHDYWLAARAQEPLWEAGGLPPAATRLGGLAAPPHHHASLAAPLDCTGAQCGVACGGAERQAADACGAGGAGS